MATKKKSKVKGKVSQKMIDIIKDSLPTIPKGGLKGLGKGMRSIPALSRGKKKKDTNANTKTVKAKAAAAKKRREKEKKERKDAGQNAAEKHFSRTDPQRQKESDKRADKIFNQPVKKGSSIGSARKQVAGAFEYLSTRQTQDDRADLKMEKRVQRTAKAQKRYEQSKRKRKRD